MHQSEAMWIRGIQWPKVAAGMVNAVRASGGGTITRRPQDYLVVPDQPWLDGFCVRKGIVRQFVAMPLGIHPEEQLTGAADHGGLQINDECPRAVAVGSPHRIPAGSSCRCDVQSRNPGACWYERLSPSAERLQDAALWRLVRSIQDGDPSRR